MAAGSAGTVVRKQVNQHGQVSRRLQPHEAQSLSTLPKGLRLRWPGFDRHSFRQFNVFRLPVARAKFTRAALSS